MLHGLANTGSAADEQGAQEMTTQVLLRLVCQSVSREFLFVAVHASKGSDLCYKNTLR